VGKHVVVISKLAEPAPNSGPASNDGASVEEGSLAPQELLPARYNATSELNVDVKEDGGPYDFDLTS
jgi:hypothetical protein